MASNNIVRKVIMKTHRSLTIVLLMTCFFSHGLSFGQNTEWRHPVEYYAEPLIGFKQYILNLEAQIDRTNLPDSVRGKVFIGVGVKLDSTISIIHVIKSDCEICNKEALRIVKSDRTKWQPWLIDGVQKESRKIFPINFQ